MARLARQKSKTGIYHIMLSGINRSTIFEDDEDREYFFVLWFNSKYERCGHLFQERFKSEAVENDSYFITVLRYTHQNPSKAGMIEEVKKSNWTSYSDYIGVPDIANIDLGLSLFSNHIEKAKEMFTNHHNEENKDKLKVSKTIPYIKNLS